MSATVHVVQHYSTPTPMVMQACDHLMAELLRREAQNSSVRDAAVSADAAVGSVEVEVVAEGADEWDAQQAALTRIRASVTAIAKVGLQLRERDRTVELLPAG